MFAVNRNPDRAEIRRFGWAMLLGLGVFGGLAWLNSKPTASLVLWGLGTGLLALSFAFPGAAKPIYVLWMTVAVCIGRVMSAVLLSVLFVLLLPFFSLVVRRGDPLRKRRATAGTYWEDYKPFEPTLERMRRPF